MTIKVKPKDEAKLKKWVADGRYQSEADAIEYLIEAEDIREKVCQGVEAADRGELVDGVTARKRHMERAKSLDS